MLEVASWKQSREIQIIDMPQPFIFSGACTSPWRQCWVPEGFRDIQLGLIQRGKTELWSHYTSTAFNLLYNPNHHCQSETSGHDALAMTRNTYPCWHLWSLCGRAHSSHVHSTAECSRWSNRLSHSCFIGFLFYILFHTAVVQPFKW